MAITQFAMVEELASLVKDNLSCKHLVLSTEEALINFLEEDMSPGGILELQPTSPYQRLLLHRLADIYGFAHESVGEGEDRHLVLERCPDSAIPSILVSDILWQYGEYQTPVTSHNILRRKEAPELKMNTIVQSSMTLEEREAAYEAARQRIFSIHEVDDKEAVAPKSRNVPVVARRMIAHALGQRIHSNEKCQDGETTDEPNNYEKCEQASIPEKKSSHRKIVGSSIHSGRVTERKGRGDTKNLEKEQIGAAKRIFAHALGLPSTRPS